MAITSFPAPKGHGIEWHLWLMANLHARYGHTWQYFAPDTYHCFSTQRFTEVGASDVCDYITAAHVSDAVWYVPYTRINGTH